MHVARRDFLTQLKLLGLDEYVAMHSLRGVNGEVISIQLREAFADKWAAGFDTTQLCQQLDFKTQSNPLDLEREILLALLLSPIPFEFPSYAELASAVRIRKNIVTAARKTSLSFDTDEAERPGDYWTYVAGCGFILKYGKCLIEALETATQPDESGKRYSFSCYRASEYVIMLSIAQELAHCHPALLRKLQQRCERSAIQSGEFHEVFLREYGTISQPVPLKYWVPGV